MDIQAIVNREHKKFSLETIHLKDEICPDEVFVRIVASGVCHTDETIIAGVTPIHKPIILGHEGAGIVEKIGADVTNVTVGDQVVIGFASCGECEYCLSGKSAICDYAFELNMNGKNRHGDYIMHTDGYEDISQFFGQSSFSQYTIVHKSSLVKVDPSLDLRYLGPLGCGIMTGAGSVLNVIQPNYGSSLVIFGTGAVGLSALMAAVIAGCGQIIAVDIHDSRLELAKKMGATHIINSTKEDVVNMIKEITNGGAHNSFETTGVGAVQELAIKCLRKHSKMFVVAVSNEEIRLKIMPDIVRPSLTIRGIIEGDAMPQLFIPLIIKFWQQGKFPFDQLIQFYKPEEIEQAFADSKSGKVIKPVIIFDQHYKPQSSC